MSHPTWRISCLIALLVCLPQAGARAAEQQPTSARVDYNRDIRPIFSSHCYACHGPDRDRRKAHLRLDRKEDAFKTLRSGNLALVPGHSDRSQLFLRVASADAAKRMPPRKTGKPLSNDEIATIRRWIDQGAEWKGHWAYIPPRRPELPAVADKAWPRNAVDYFVLARLEKQGLRPAPEGDRATLIRRLTFDLTGLPPTPAEVDAFLADRSPDAYEKVVDHLLVSPRYGERMAQHWLDLARYADTNGYHIDNHRDMWMWRAWVIQAFNQNMPFDEFTVKQLAGDMLHGATLDQRIASGFNRNVMINFEGGADPDEYATKYVIDRVDTTATVWLGTTLGCAECHDHKYDPFTQKEFYQFYAFFDNIPEKGLDGQKENAIPSIRVPTAAQQARLAAYRHKAAALESHIRQALAKVKIDDAAPAVVSKPAEAREYVWVNDSLPPGAVAEGNEGAASWRWVPSPGHPAHSGRKASKRSARGRSQHFFTGANPRLKIGAGDRLFAHVYLDPKDPPRTIMLQFNDGTWEHRAYWGSNLIDWGVDKTASRFPMGALPAAGQWVRLEVAPQAVGLKPGTALNGLAFTQHDGTVYWDRAGIVTRMPQGPRHYRSLAEWEQAEKTSPAAHLPRQVRNLIKTDPKTRTPQQRLELNNYFVEHVYAKTRAVFAPLHKQLAALKRAEAELEEVMPSTMVMQEMATPRATHVLVRGNFQRKGAKVTAGVPRSLPPLPRGVKADRLALARWLVAPDHPLTSRVTVNRYWEQLFGTGLVKTSQDFGSQGEWPSHPELLDWLATEFVAQKWDIKAFQKVLVMSATYRQSAQASPDSFKLDPENRLLARGPRFRLSAEMIRDNALAVSGLLDHRLGGPSVRPYQPAGLWDAIAFGGGFSSQTYVQSHGRDLYRRGIYTYWKRSLPYPSLNTFDAPSREVCTDRRPRTNTPLQALVLMNDPVYVEAARVLGQRVLKEGGPDTAARMAFAFKLCTARAPAPDELKLLTRIFERQLAKYRNDPKAAVRLITIGECARPANLDAGELAAWTAIGNILLNLDETITKG
ncbi:MAG TPA: PSD1 and planctomycete cytochrome C domain-containing protein [Gemmataceae bacterium]|jgi:hypothetical protein|nr:PSD1 and planctomycete cytochrome C domain-containing protein [Gemmataceae bacterium]